MYYNCKIVSVLELIILVSSLHFKHASSIPPSVCSGPGTTGNLTLSRDGVIINVESLFRNYLESPNISYSDDDDRLHIFKNATSTQVLKNSVSLIRAKFDRIWISSQFHPPFNSKNFALSAASTFLGLLNSNEFTTSMEPSPQKLKSVTLVFTHKGLGSGNTTSSLETAKLLAEEANKKHPGTVSSLLLDATGAGESITLPQIFYLIDFAKKTKKSVSTLKVGYITGTTGNHSICTQLSTRSKYESSKISKIARLAQMVYIKPRSCTEIDELPIVARYCYSEVVQEVERCVEFLRGKVGNRSFGLVTSTTVFGEDYASRADYWCLLNDYGRKTGLPVVILDDDNFIRDYLEGGLKMKEDGKEEDEESLELQSPLSYGGGIVLIFVVVFLTGIQYIRYKRKIAGLKAILSQDEILLFRNGEEESESGGGSGSLWTNLPYSGELEVSKDDVFIDVHNVLGSGAYGIVYLGQMTRTGVEVAVKTVKHAGVEVDSSGLGLRGLLSEIKVLSYLGEHEGIVNLLGAYTAELEQGVLFVVSEYCVRGSLEKYLRSLRNTEDPNYMDLFGGDDNSDGDTAGHDMKPKLIRFSLEICRGMEFLADKRVIHGDLATRNILVTQDHHVKISDFGLSRRLYEYTNYVKSQQVPLPWKWMSPEALQLLSFSEKSDVWAYGISLWEIFTLGNSPYPGLSWHPEFPKELEQGLRLGRPEHCSPILYEDIMLQCWEINPEERPAFTELATKLLSYADDASN